MFSPELRSAIEEKTGTIGDVSILSGGDIHQAYVFTASSSRWVAKVAKSHLKIESLKAELHGLKILSKTSTFHIPEILGLFQLENETALVMRFVESTAPAPDFWEDFANKLAALHSHSQSEFGLDRDNFIGALPQYNYSAQTALDFYINSRLEPQFKMASKAGYTFNTDPLYKKLDDIIPDQRPALIHGDLWNGNYLSGSKGPVLIDPAVCYGIAEMDLGMMSLFGGFGNSVFDVYSEIQGLSNWQERIELWQLYYLLVHLNLFGSSYYSSVKNTVIKYS